MWTHRSPALGACLALAVALAGCGGSQPQPRAAHPTPHPSASAAPATKPSPAGQIARAQLEGVLIQGPPWILRRVPVEEVIRGGAFIGWKMLSLPAEWSTIDLKAGDVVTKVNSATLENPDDLFEAWRGLASAKEIRIAYEREGAARELVIPIAGDPSKDFAKALEQPAPRRRTTPAPRGVTVIEEDDSTPPEDDDAP